TANIANTSAPPNVASDGTNSRRPDRTMTMTITVATSAKNAQRRAQMARRDIGWMARRRRTIASVPGPKFACSLSGTFANFGSKGTLESLSLLVSLWFGSSLPYWLRIPANFRTATLAAHRLERGPLVGGEQRLRRAGGRRGVDRLDAILGQRMVGE